MGRCIKRHHPQTRVQQRLYQAAQVRGVGAPAMDQQHRRALPPFVHHQLVGACRHPARAGVLADGRGPRHGGAARRRGELSKGEVSRQARCHAAQPLIEAAQGRRGGRVCKAPGAWRSQALRHGGCVGRFEIGRELVSHEDSLGVGPRTRRVRGDEESTEGCLKRPCEIGHGRAPRAAHSGGDYRLCRAESSCAPDTGLMSRGRP